jgi:hypothetical protein
MFAMLTQRETHFRIHGRLLQGWFAFAPVMLAMLLSPRALFSDQDLSKTARINLIRALTSEIAVTKISLPRGKHGVILDTNGKLDAAEANKELRSNGPAILPGMPVEITRLTFKSDRIIFEINGGGKRGKKWYQRIEIGVGTQTMPIAQQPPVLTYGSWITLKLPDKTHDLSVDQAKNLLAGTLDFTRHSPTVLYSRATPPEFKEAIEKHQVLVGMDRDTVLSSRGAPDRKVREDRPDGTSEEDWIYGLPPHVLYVIFEGDTVARVKQY